MKTVIITDGKYRSSIPAARALGRAGYNVVVTQTRGDDDGTPPVFCSKYVAESRWIEGFAADEDYPARLMALIGEYERPVLFCVGAASLNRVSQSRDEFSKLCDFLIAPPETLDALNDKEQVHARSVRLGLPVPKQYSTTPDEYPVIIKPHCGEKFGLKAKDRYAIANDPDQFEKKLAAMAKYDPSPIIQRRVAGDGAGVSLLLGSKGELLCALCHRRIREYPVTGGPSTCCVSFYNDNMISDAYALLKSFNFTGMAMVEFKGKYILEVNPRVWGSFPMTECARTGFTLRYAAACAGQAMEYVPGGYDVGVKMRFTLNDTVATLGYFGAGRFAEGFRGIGDAFSAQEALRDDDDPAPFKAYLKNAIMRK